MFLKIMEFKETGSIDEKETKKHLSSRIIDCESVTFYDEKDQDGTEFTLFITNQNKPTEIKIRFNHSEINKGLHSVYIMNDEGKTIQKPV